MTSWQLDTFMKANIDEGMDGSGRAGRPDDGWMNGWMDVCIYSGVHRASIRLECFSRPCIVQGLIFYNASLEKGARTCTAN